MKVCAKCGETKPLEAFTKKETAYHSYCKQCRRRDYQKKYSESEVERERMRLRNIQRRLSGRTLIEEAKNVPCTDCGKRYPKHVMDFDHLIAGEKHGNLSWMVGRYSLEVIQQEIDKCEVVCANCHRERTHQRRVDS